MQVLLAMDIARPELKQKKRRRQIVGGVVALVFIVLISIGLSRLKPAAPSVDRSTVWVDTVKRGSMIRQVRGLGTLTPMEIRWIPTLSDGRVEKILVQVGQAVKADTVLVVLSNPQVEQAATDADFALKAAEADLNSQQTQLQSAYLAQKSLAAK